MGNVFTNTLDLFRKRVRKAKTARARLGQRGENCAVRLLQAKAYQILARNVRYKNLEVDIIARDGLNLVIIEVKSSHRFRPRDERKGIPLHKEQKNRLLRAARIYYRQIGSPRVPVRFDFIEVTFFKNVPILRHIRHIPGFWDANVRR